MRSEHVTTFIIFMAIVICAIGCGPPKTDSPYGQIEGTITDNETGDPIVGATIMVVDTKKGWASDLKGHYAIEEVPPGVYAVRMSAVEYRTVQLEDVKVMRGKTIRIDQTLKKPPPRRRGHPYIDPPGEIRIPEHRWPILEPDSLFGQIKGTVTDVETGEPIVGAIAYLVDEEIGRSTDQTGNYVIGQVPSGVHTLRFVASGYLTAELADVKIERTATITVDLALRKVPLQR